MDESEDEPRSLPCSPEEAKYMPVMVQLHLVDAALIKTFPASRRLLPTVLRHPRTTNTRVTTHAFYSHIIFRSNPQG